MARRKDQSPLFEIIRGTQEGGGRPRIELPPWLKHPPQDSAGNPRPSGGGSNVQPSAPRPQAQGGSVSASTAASAAKAAPPAAATANPTAKTPAPPHPRLRGADTTRPTQATPATHASDPSAIRIHHAPAAGLAGWFGHMVELRATRQRLVVLGSAAALAILVIYFGAYHIGVAVGQREDQPDPSLASLGGSIATNPDTPDSLTLDRLAIATATPTRGGQTGPAASTAGPERTPAGPSRSAAPADRSPAPGFNYFILETLPSTAVADGEKIIDYLGSKGVDAALVPANDSGSRLWVVVLEGFSGESSPEASRLKNRLLQLGRGWKRQGGARDWSDMYGRLFK